MEIGPVIFVSVAPTAAALGNKSPSSPLPPEQWQEEGVRLRQLPVAESGVRML